MSNYWPWWAGAIGLALVVINYTVATDRSFGVSTAWERVLRWRSERRAERMDAELPDDRALVEALAAATAEQFGPAPDGLPDPAYAAPVAQPYGPGAETSADAPHAEPLADAPRGDPAAGRTPVARVRPMPVISQAALLVSMFAGGWAAAATTGRFDLRLDMGDGFRQIVTDDPVKMVGALFLGGVLVGFGTRLSGGCSSGHGLSGCGRLQPVSLVATTVFFGTAVAMSFLLWKVI